MSDSSLESSCNVSPAARLQQQKCEFFFHRKHAEYTTSTNKLFIHFKVYFYVIWKRVISNNSKNCWFTSAPPQNYGFITLNRSREIISFIRNLQNVVSIHAMRYCIYKNISTWFAQIFSFNHWLKENIAYLELSSVSNRGTCQLLWIKPRSSRILARELLMIKTCRIVIRVANWSQKAWSTLSSVH